MRWYQRKILGVIEVLPVLLPMFFAVASLQLLVLAIIGQLLTLYIGLAFVVSFVLAVVVCYRYYPRQAIFDRSRQLWNGITLIVLLCWGGINMTLSSQDVVVEGDAGSYANTAAWIASRPNLDMQVPDSFGNLPFLFGGGVDFNTMADQPSNKPGTPLYTWGNSGYQVLLGSVGRFVGVENMLILNVLFTVIGLLAVYAVARLVAHPGWAAITVFILAVSMPILYIARDTYTEPLSMALIFGGISSLVLALTAKKTLLWFFAGIMGGSAAITRIDAYIVVAAFALVAFIVLLTNIYRHKHKTGQVAAYLGGLALPSVLGLVNLLVLTPSYFWPRSKEVFLELALIGVIYCLGTVMYGVNRRHDIMSWLDKKTKPWRFEAVVLLLGAIVAFLLARPLLLSIGKAPETTYSLFAPYWHVWYLGAAFLFASGIGLVMALKRGMQKGSVLLLAICIVVLSTALLYLYKPSISPEQVYAMRRFVPVVLPGLAIFAAVGLTIMYRAIARRVRFRYAYAALLAVFLPITPLLVSKPLALKQTKTQLPIVKQVCASLPKDAAVIWTGNASRNWSQPTMTFCSLPAMGYGKLTAQSTKEYTLSNITREELVALSNNARANNKLPVVASYEADAGEAAQQMTLIGEGKYKDIKQTGDRPPTQIFETGLTIRAGEINPAGKIVPLKGAVQ